MTLPYERRWAINNTKQFLLDIGINESLPDEVRKEAWRNLKHYPGEYHMEEARKAAPEVFGDWEDMKHDRTDYMFADRPDNWVVLEIMASVNDANPIYKVLAGWSGGYLNGDSWKINSGIVKVLELDDSWVFIGNSGSEYVCHKEQYKLRMNNAGIYEELLTAYPNLVRMMPEDTDWSTLKLFVN